MSESIEEKRLATISRLLRDSYSVMSVPKENYGLYRIAAVQDQPPSTLLSEFKRRISAAWDCLMGRGNE